ncbi:MAG: hypothetical protein QME66_04920 [Candidatus Eisenbacteria bacterium]|nr:hypothetical protein [Candidatus Eisenbacteria bacterium]
MSIEVEKLDERVVRAIDLAEKLVQDNRRLTESVKQLQVDLRSRKKTSKEGSGITSSDFQKMSKVTNTLLAERKALLRRLEEILKKLNTVV